MAAPELVQEVFTVIEGGADLGSAAEIIQFPSDNGQNVYNVVQKTQQGANGTGLNYWVLAFETLVGETLAAVSAGAALLTMEVTGAAAMIGPALGLAVGYAWYNLAPEFWEGVADDLVNAGRTINGKVVCLLNEYGNITFPEDVVEIYKDALLEAGAFEIVKDIPEYQTTGAYRIDKALTFPQFVGYLFRKSSMEVVFEGDAAGDWTNLLLTYRDWYCYGHIPIQYSGIHPLATWMVMVIFEPRETIDLGTTPDNSISIWFRSFWRYEDQGRINQIVVREVTTGAYPGYTYASFVGQYLDSSGEGSWKVSGIDCTYVGNKIQPDAKLPTSDPVTTTYPNWIWDFPPVPTSEGTQELPSGLPVEYPDILPKVETVQNPAQDPGENTEENPDKVIETITENNPRIKPNPGSNAETDNDSQAEEEENIDDGGDGKDTTNSDPIDPDPPIIPTPVIPITPLPSTVSSNKLFTVYNPSTSQLDQLGGYLWDNDLIDVLKRIWQNPLDGIIGLMQVYVTPTTGSSHNIILGYLDSGVSAPVVTNQFVTIDCGSVQINEVSENPLDYTPYTQMQIYLPFIGIAEIDTNEFMAGTINVKYKVDVYTGSCIAEVKCTRSGDMPNGAILYTYNGNCSQQLPLTSGDQKGLLQGLISAAGLGLSVASGGALTAISAAGMLNANISREMCHVAHSGNLSSNAGIMGQKKPYVILNRKRAYNANNYNAMYGYPVNKSIYPGNHSGYFRMKAGRLRTAATEEEKNEILEWLKKGVIL